MSARRGEPVAGAFLTAFGPFLLAFSLGALAVLAFEPVGLWFGGLVVLVFLFQRFALAASPREGFYTGYGFGLGFFLAGVSWIYVSLHTFGAMPMLLAGLATFLFCAFLALFPAAVGYLTARTPCSPVVKALLIAPATWTLIEWTRGWIFSGFPWLTFGYSQAPDSPLAGYAPIVGVYGLSLLLASSAGALALVSHRALGRHIGARGSAHDHPKHVWRPENRLALTLLLTVALFWLGGALLKKMEWTQPTGVVTTVSLLQGNVPQDMKWREDKLLATLATYRDMVKANPAQLIVLPETALPLFLHQVPPDYLAELTALARQNNGDILIGIPERLSSGEYFNSIMSLGHAPQQVYRKSHLVPFGEFIPLRPLLGWIVGVLAIPLQDFSRGGIDQQPLNVAGQRVAVNICYEDVFGEEIIRQLPQATLLVNASNVAWFGRSIAPQQHLQISQMRALETGRYMLRATNTGATAVINTRGQVEGLAPTFTTTALTHTVPGYQGATPFVRWGNLTALLSAAVMLLIAAFIPRKSL